MLSSAPFPWQAQLIPSPIANPTPVTGFPQSGPGASAKPGGGASNYARYEPDPDWGVITDTRFVPGLGVIETFQDGTVVLSGGNGITTVCHTNGLCYQYSTFVPIESPPVVLSPAQPPGPARPTGPEIGGGPYEPPTPVPQGPAAPGPPAPPNPHRPPVGRPPPPHIEGRPARPLSPITVGPSSPTTPGPQAGGPVEPGGGGGAYEPEPHGGSIDIGAGGGEIATGGILDPIIGALGFILGGVAKDLYYVNTCTDILNSVQGGLTTALSTLRQYLSWLQGVSQEMLGLLKACPGLSDQCVADIYNMLQQINQAVTKMLSDISIVSPITTKWATFNCATFKGSEGSAVELLDIGNDAMDDLKYVQRILESWTSVMANFSDELRYLLGNCTCPAAPPSRYTKPECPRGQIPTRGPNGQWHCEQANLQCPPGTAKTTTRTGLTLQIGCQPINPFTGA